MPPVAGDGKSNARLPIINGGYSVDKSVAGLRMLLTVVIAPHIRRILGDREVTAICSLNMPEHPLGKDGAQDEGDKKDSVIRCRSSVVEHPLGNLARAVGNDRERTAQIRGNVRFGRRQSRANRRVAPNGSYEPMAKGWSSAQTPRIAGGRESASVMKGEVVSSILTGSTRCDSGRPGFIRAGYR
jgi:hypothetical protein